MTSEMFNMIYLGDTQGDCKNKMCLFVKLPEIIEQIKSWVKVSGQWLEANVFVKVAGIWKSAIPYVKINKVWKYI